MLRSPHRDEREAMTLADIASAHDAGLDVDQILTGATTASLDGDFASGRGLNLTEGLAAKGMDLPPHERLMLETAERAGNVGDTLRNLASQREQRARRNRELGRALAYPLFLLAFGAAISMFTASFTGGSLWTPIGILVAMAAGVAGLLFYVVRATGREDGGNIPWLSPAVRDYGELPYLHSMHGLYRAGVPIHDAHETALRTSPITGVRLHLYRALTLLQGDQGYADALQHSGALHPETRQLLSSAEIAGDLENALARAIVRREDSLERNTRVLIRIAIAAIMVLVYGYVIYVVLNFYSNYYRGILGG